MGGHGRGEVRLGAGAELSDGVGGGEVVVEVLGKVRGAVVCDDGLGLGLPERKAVGLGLWFEVC